ncbi:DUF871 domain-containing protein [Eubacterium multiforme]|uniref:DUF871 domain-containing protein n=1 Tax=Eubacterium multiforme TaxID=83339 RepID=A0ABT9UX59_9FIRM|nr:MupG family TIM beta-alpha barrel fold protein [Eubacterium multiforme]MDQ0150834.1 hypothetical protein [Eubacterium multiforme]
MSLGISVYFGLDNSKEENMKLLNKAYKLGYKRIFTSLQVPEADYTVLKSEVGEFLKQAKEYNMDIISDISPNTFKLLDLENKDIYGLYKLGIKTIRIDYGYNEEDIANMSKNEHGINIQINASTLTSSFLDNLERYNADFCKIDALHNFYPRRGTGISKEYMIKVNSILNKRNIKVCAFVQSNSRKRSPLKEGLPTLEDHRDLNVEVAANELYALGCNDIFIGDSLPSDDELMKLTKVNKDEVVLRIEVFTKSEVCLRLLKNKYTARVDEARDAIRAQESRTLLGKNDIIEPEISNIREIGYITIDNRQYLRYMGELQIIKQKSSKDDRINIVARVIEEDLCLLKYIKGGKRFSFIAQ